MSDRLQYLQSLSESSGEDSSTKLHLPEWKRKNHAVGDIFFVKRRLWKNADRFSTNEKRVGHPGVVTIPSKRGSGTFMLVPSTTSRPVGHSYFFCPKEEINYSNPKWSGKKSSFVLDYWRPVSRKGPFEIGKLAASDAELLQSKMIEVHRNEYIHKAYGEE